MAQNYIQSNINNHCKHLQSNRMFDACVRGGIGGSIKSQFKYCSFQTHSPDTHKVHSKGSSAQSWSVPGRCVAEH